MHCLEVKHDRSVPAFVKGVIRDRRAGNKTGTPPDRSQAGQYPQPNPSQPTLAQHTRRQHPRKIDTPSAIYALINLYLPATDKPVPKPPCVVAYCGRRIYRSIRLLDNKPLTNQSKQTRIIPEATGQLGASSGAEPDVAENAADDDPAISTTAISATANSASERLASRRAVIRRGAKILVYTAPFVQLIRPAQALGASGSAS